MRAIASFVVFFAFSTAVTQSNAWGTFYTAPNAIINPKVKSLTSLSVGLYPLKFEEKAN